MEKRYSSGNFDGAATCCAEPRSMPPPQLPAPGARRAPVSHICPIDQTTRCMAAWLAGWCALQTSSGAPIRFGVTRRRRKLLGNGATFGADGRRSCARGARSGTCMVSGLRGVIGFGGGKVLELGAPDLVWASGAQAAAVATLFSTDCDDTTARSAVIGRTVPVWQNCRFCRISAQAVG